MKPWIWLVVAAVGWAMMLAGYSSRAPLDRSAPCSSGRIMIGPVPAQTKEKAGAKPAEKTPATPKAAPEMPAEEGAFPGAIPIRVRLLSANDVAETILNMAGDEAFDKAIGTKAQVRLKLIEVPLDKAALGPNSASVRAAARGGAR